MRRYVPSSLDSIKAKAKLFHRSIENIQNDGIGLIKPGYRLTDAQADLARVLGFENWAEIKSVVSKGPDASLIGGDTFFSMARKLASLTGSSLISTSLLARLGLATDMGTSGLTSPSDYASQTEFARSIDLLTERLMEVDLSTREARNIFGLIDALAIPTDGILGMIGYVESLRAWGRFTVRGEKLQLARRFADHALIERFGKDLPRSGIFAMSGATGTGRSHAGIVLAKQMRGSRRVVFSLSTQCGLEDGRVRPGSIVFIDDLPHDDAIFRRLTEIARHSLVILCVIAGDQLDAHNRVWLKLRRDVELQHEEASGLVAGGIHCGRNMDMAALTPWNPPHWAYFANAETRIFDDMDLHFRNLADLVALKLPRDCEGAVDRAAAHASIVGAVLETTDAVATWRGEDLNRRVSERLDEMGAAYQWLRFRAAKGEGAARDAS